MRKHNEKNNDRTDLDVADERKLTEELRSGLDQLDRLQPIYTPDRQWFSQFVAEGSKKQRQRLLRELLVFWLIAATALTGTLVTLNLMPTIFLWIQGTSLVILPIIISSWKRVKEL